MFKKLHSVSVNTLFAAAVGCIIQVVLSVLQILIPFILLWSFAWDDLKFIFMQFVNDRVHMFPQIIVGAVAMIIITVLYIISYKKIQKSKKSKTVKLWSTISLICSFLLFGYYSSIISIVAVLGLIGSISGLLYKEEL